jgi:hypothetical protein
MNKLELCHLCLSLFAGTVLGLALALATHWSVGVLLLLVWIVVHGLTWGFAEPSAKQDEPHQPDSETLS